MTLEASNMEGHARNGAPFDKYFSRYDLMVHAVMSSKDELLGFAISGNEGRGKAKVYVYELHVATAQRRRGLARTLLDMCEKSSASRGRTSPMLELQVHATNVSALSFYNRVGFVKISETSNGGMFVMQRKR